MTGSLHVLFPGGKKPDRGPRDAADDIFAAWLTYSKSRADITDGTKKNYARVIRNVSPWAGDTSFLDLDLHVYVHLRRDAGTAPRTIELELCIIRMVFRWAKEEGLIPKKAHMRFPKLRIDRKKFKINHRTPSAGEVARVLAVMPDDDWKAALALLAKTGARVGEVTSLRSCDLDVAGSSIAVGSTEGDTKTGLRWFPLDPAGVEALRGRAGRGEVPLFDFGGTKNPEKALTNPKQALRKRLTAACIAAHVPEFTPHGLRRMVVGRLMRAGVDPGTAASLTGHSVTVMLQLYQEVTDEDRRAAAEQAALGVLADG